MNLLALGFVSFAAAKLAAVLGALGFLALGMSWLTSEPTVQYLISIGFADALGFPRIVRSILAKTANYTVLVTDGSGTVFTNRGAAGAVTYTLPAPTPQLTGVVYEFHGVADQVFTVSAGAGKAVAFNNAAAASLAASTAGQKIGARIKAICDGTSWLLVGEGVACTYTVA
jgi:ABC-type proline/glycine betaine transport system substrate-binding protein